MRAKFIGEDGREGYRYGQAYDLTVTEQGKYVLVLSPRPIPYDSWKAFFENWQRTTHADE